MKKLNLDLETLEVETFPTAETPTEESAADAFLTNPQNCVTFGCGDSVNRPC
ncbi:MAG TPA: hypothetical protein VFQ45_08550 [Longimicrobium sp.]|nr:hypothetical protein [Longimicrobium sp.]